VNGSRHLSDLGHVDLVSIYEAGYGIYARQVFQIGAFKEK